MRLSALISRFYVSHDLSSNSHRITFKTNRPASASGVSLARNVKKCQPVKWSEAKLRAAILHTCRRLLESGIVLLRKSLSLCPILYDSAAIESFAKKWPPPLNFVPDCSNISDALSLRACIFPDYYLSSCTIWFAPWFSLRFLMFRVQGTYLCVVSMVIYPHLPLGSESFTQCLVPCFPSLSARLRVSRDQVASVCNSVTRILIEAPQTHWFIMRAASCQLYYTVLILLFLYFVFRW